MKEELFPELEKYREAPFTEQITGTIGAYLQGQIVAAQEFLNENSKADLSRVKCLLRKMFPRNYHDIIDQLKQHQDSQIIINICGGQNLIAPNAKETKLESPQ